MSLTAIMAEDRRLAVLLSLMEAGGYELNEDTLKLMLGHLGHVVTKDVLRGDLAWLRDQALIRTETLHVASGDLWVAHLLGSGQDVANGAAWPGIARPRAH